MELWHNPRCSKSRQTKALLDERDVPYRERRYLDEPPTVEELDGVLRALGLEPWEVARLGDAVARELDLKAWPHERDRWLAVMVEHPALIERPILLTEDGRAAVGRPPEAVLVLL